MWPIVTVVFLPSYRYTGRTIKAINMGSYNYLGYAENEGPRIETIQADIPKFGVGLGSAPNELGMLCVCVCVCVCVCTFIANLLCRKLLADPGLLIPFGIIALTATSTYTLTNRHR